MDKLVGGRYQLKRRIGAGSFGEIYEGEDVKSGKHVAVKLEKLKTQVPQLEAESKVYHTISGCTNAASLYYFGIEIQTCALVIDFLSSSLESLRVAGSDGRLSSRSVLMLAPQMISAIEFLHRMNMIHGDIKPENFMMGNGANSNKVYMIDFGLTRHYRDPTTHQHIPFKEHIPFSGTARYASAWALRGHEQSRRDDMYSWLYTVCSLCEVGLPWKQEDGIQEIGELKKKNPVSQLVEPLGEEMVEIAKHIEALKYDEAPNYTMIHTLLNKKHTSMNTEVPYQWMTLQPINPERFKKLESKKPEYTTLFSGNNLDPTQFLMSLTKYDEVYHSSCLLI